MRTKPLRFIMLGAVALSTALSTLCAMRPAHAVVLEQKWQTGQQLSYDMKIDGTLHVTAPEGVPMIAGLPLEILLKGEGQSTLAAHEVDDFGTAIVAARLERLQLKMNETTFNQNGVLGIRDGRASLSMNGQSVVPATDVRRWIEPDHGVRITKQLRVTGVAPLSEKSPQAEPEAQADDKKTPLRIPLDFMAMMQAMIARTLPAVLPAKDVELGEEWKANVEWPQAPGASRSEFEKPLGTFTMKALGEEEILGRKTWRISLDGNVNVSQAQSKIVREEYEARRTPETANDKPAGMTLPKLFNIAQKVKGDIWFDVNAGQIVRADLNLSSNAQTRAAENARADGSMDYAGKLQLDLRKVSYKGR